MPTPNGHRESAEPPGLAALPPRCVKMREVLQGGRRLLIFLHDNPDPDAIAAGFLLLRLSAQLGVPAQLLYGGRLGRAENRAMVQLLRIPLRSLEQVRLRPLQTDRNALVDTQPLTGNNSFPEGGHCHLVFDHHPLRKNYSAEFVDVRPGQSSSTAMLLEYFEGFGLKLDSTLATAAAYGITSETQDLEREASREDLEAYQRLLPLVRQQVLGRIRHPIRERDYYRTIARAMRKVQVSKNLCLCHIGAVPHAEIVAEMADFFAPMERVTWCLVTGLHQERIVLSIRTKYQQGHADRVMRQILGKQGKGGGHGRIAGGVAPCEPSGYDQLAAHFTERFVSRVARAAELNFQHLLEEPPAVSLS